MANQHMRSADDYAELAEQALAEPDPVSLRPRRAIAAQVYATLALAAATREIRDQLRHR